MQKKRFFGSVALTLVSVFSFGSCSLLNGILGNQSESSEEVYMAVRATSPKDGGRAVLANEDISNFAAGYTKYAAEDYAYRGDHYVMSGLTLEWEADGTPQSYEIKLSENSNLSNAMEFETESAELHIDDLFVNTAYYWQITAIYADKKETSKINEFTTAKTPRTLNIDGVSNTRDIGGMNLADGKQIRQGMIYRGGALDGITQEGKMAALETYGIKTDLDLRNMAEGTAGESSPLGEGVNYVHVNASPYYLGGTTGVDYSGNWGALATSMRVFTKAENFPVYVHCSLGRDRTAAVCFLVEALLGASQEDIFMDYETSFFSKLGNTDGQTVEYMVNSFSGLYNYIAGNYGRGDTLAQKCEKFLISDVGLTQSEVDAIRKNLTK